MSDASAGASGRPTRGSAAARLRLVRKAASVLVPLENAEVQADVENWPLAQTEVEPRLLRTDLLITASDLRLRVCALPGRPPKALEEADTSRAALLMLLTYPETSAVVVVADDEDLTARLFEPADGPNAVESVMASAGEGERRGPLPEVVRAYLRQVSSHWDVVPPLSAAHEDFRAEARSLAAEHLDALKVSRKNTPEWRAARSSLDQADAAWAADIAIRLRLEADTDVVALLESHARHLGAR